MNKFEIIEAMKVKPTINPEEEVRLRVEFIKKQLLQSGLSSLVLGISGGIDSATCGRLAQKAINELNEVKVMIINLLLYAYLTKIKKMKMMHNYRLAL